MSKNMTRRGLALCAGFSMVATSLIALPAAAADGIVSDKVKLLADNESANYTMLTTGYLDIDASFAFSAQSGGELKIRVTDPDLISVFDADPEDVTDTTTLTGNEAIAKIASVNAASDLVTVYHSNNKTANNVVVGDVIEIDEVDDNDVDFKDTILSSINTLQQVVASSTLDQTIPAATTGVVVVGAAGSGSITGEERVTVKVGDADDIHVGAILTITPNAAGDLVQADTTANTIDFTGDYVVEEVDTANDTVSFTMDADAEAGNTFNLDTGDTLDVDSNSLTFQPGVEITSSIIAPKAGAGNPGDVIEVSDAGALDDLDEIREGAFGAAGLVGVATTRSSTTGIYVIDTKEEDASAGDQKFRLGTSADSADGSVTVQAWIDTDDDGVLDSTEDASAEQVITFVKPASVSYDIAATGVFIDSTTVSATVTAADLNLEAVQAQSLLRMDVDRIAANGTVTQDGSTVSFTWDDAAGKKIFATADDTVTTLATGDSVRFQIEDTTLASTSAHAQDATGDVGSASTFGVGTLTVAGSAMKVNAGANVTEGTELDTTGENATGITVKVRKGAGSATATYTAFNGDPTDTTADKVVPNVPVTATVTSSNVTAADGVKINGTVVDGGTETIVGNTNASGQFVISLTETKADAGDSVVVTLTVQGKSTSGKVTFNFEDTTYSVYDVAGNLTASTDYNQQVVVGGSLTKTYWVADQFGQTPDNGDAAITVTRNGSTRTDDATWGYQAPVVDGLATVTITDDGTGLGNDTVTVKVFDLLPGGGLAGSPDDTNTYTLTYVNTATDYTPSSVTGAFNHDGVDDSTTDDLPVVLETKALFAHDSRGAMGVNAPSGLASKNVDVNGDGDVADGGDAQLTFSGTLKNANGGGIAGSPVTISIPGAFMKFSTADSETVYAENSITVNTDAAGNYTVDVYAAQGGSKTATVTAGTATATDDVTFAGNSVGADLTLTLPAAVEASSSFQVTANLTDEFGDGADTAAGRMKVTYSGPGIYFGSLPTETDANGDLSFSVLLGANDSGTITVTVSYDENGDGDYTDADDLTVTKSLVVGQSADQKVNAGSFKGYVAVYAKGYAGSRLSAKIGNDWVIVPSLASNFERVTDFTGAGYDIAVRIYIDRVLVDTIPLTTK